MPVHVPRNPPLPATLPARSRWQLLEEAFQPIRRNTGTTYPCTASELKDATTPSRRPARRPVSKHQASYSIQAHNALGNHLSHEDYAAICRLENATLGVFAGRYWSPDLIIKAFCDLDRVFFLGHLRGHVYVRWRSQRSFPQRIPHRLTMGRTDYLGGGKAVIYLNADGIFADTAMSAFKEMWRTLLHEMCHAYEFTQVVSREWSGSDTHGRQFGSKIRAVHERARREIHVGAMHKGDTFNDVGSERRRGH